jgi:uncharacterized phosphosugar-binding protein
VTTDEPIGARACEAPNGRGAASGRGPAAARLDAARLDAATFAAAARDVFDRVVDSQQAALARAADLVVAALHGGGVLQTFGTGHSEALTMELAGRAGGLVPTSRIALRDLVLYGDAPREVLASGTLERDPQVARRLYELADPDPRDIFVVASNSGINGSVVELALLVTGRGHPLVAITSSRHSARVPSRHPSGRRLGEIADVVLDNGAPYGDALLPLAGGGAVGAVSSITSALLAQMLTVEVVRRMQDAGDVPPVYLSANVPGGDEHNRTLELRYAGRIRRSA